jgi:hypothetical protein
MPIFHESEENVTLVLKKEVGVNLEQESLSRNILLQLMPQI